MVHGTCSERSRDAALSPVHTSRRYSPPRPAGLQRPLAQTAGCHAHSPLSVRGALSRALGTHSVHFRYELPGTAVLKKYKRGIHEYLNIKVCVCVAARCTCVSRDFTQDHFLYLSIQDPHCPPRSGYNEEKNTSVWTNGGRMKVRYIIIYMYTLVQPSTCVCVHIHIGVCGWLPGVRQGLSAQRV